nr:vacuolar protein sorting-associated protein 37A [Leptinotarsa decemlineata]
MLPRLYKSDADIRKHQINTLKIFNDNVTEIIEGEEYEIYFNSGGNNLCLKIILTKEFPKEKPLLKIVPRVIHQWVSEEGDIKSAPGLLNFTVHSDLGRVVQAVIREYQRTPPPLVTNNVCNNTSAAIPINGEVRPTPSTYQFSVKSFSPPSHMPQAGNFLPNIAVSELIGLPLEELKFLNDNSDRQEEFIEEVPIIKEQNRVLDDVISQVEEMAEINLSKKEKLEELQRDIDSRIEEVTKLAFENERLHVIYQTLSDKYTPRNIKDQLRLAAEKADVDSEKVAESFLSGEIDVDKFVTDFIKIKTLSQTRKTKEEKLGQQLDRLEKAGF